MKLSKSNKWFVALFVTATIFMSVVFWTKAFAAEVAFTWGISTGQVDGYRIYWGDSQGGPYPDRLIEVNGTTLDCVASLNEEQAYYLVCRAFNVYGESGNSNETYWSYAVPGCPGELHWTINLSQLMEFLGADKIQFISK